MEEETVKLSRHLEDHDALKQEYDDLRRRLIEVRVPPVSLHSPLHFDHPFCVEHCGGLQLQSLGFVVECR